MFTFCHSFPKGKQCLLWTDFVLSLVIFVGLVTVFVIGIFDVPGGFAILMERAKERWPRDEIPSNGSTHSYGSMIVGQFVIWLFIYSAYYGSGKYWSAQYYYI